MVDVALKDPVTAVFSNLVPFEMFVREFESRMSVLGASRLLYGIFSQSLGVRRESYK